MDSTDEILERLARSYAELTMRSNPDRLIEYPYQHPAAKEANQIFLTLEVYSEAHYRKLARRDRYVWDVCWFEAEVGNGGMDQYFYNSPGDHIAECLEALAAIGAKNSYAVLKRACDLFPDGRPSPSREIRMGQLRELRGNQHLDDLIQGEEEIEVELYQHLIDYYRQAGPELM